MARTIHIDRARLCAPEQPTAASIAAKLRGKSYEQAQNLYERGYISQTEWDVYGIVWRRSAFRYSSEASGCEFDHGPELERLAAEVAALEGFTLRPARPAPEYADQRGHDVTWMTAAERDAHDVAPSAAELFKRTAPRWNCVDYPNDGPHYTPNGDCVWCGMTRAEISAEYAKRASEVQS